MAKNPAAVALGRRGGRAYVKNTTPEQRTEAARKAVKARWAKAKQALEHADARIQKNLAEISDNLKKGKS
jgi:hypothetical protein